MPQANTTCVDRMTRPSSCLCPYVRIVPAFGAKCQEGPDGGITPHAVWLPIISTVEQNSSVHAQLSFTPTDVMDYQHTQTGALHLIVFATAGILFAGAWFAHGDAAAAVLLAIVAALTLALAFCFKTLTVRDEGDRLAIRFGPLPLFRGTIRYAEITAVEPGRTSFIDGWGVHYLPLRGATYNLWGFGCVKLTLGKKVIRIGTDDVDGLIEVLRAKIKR